MNERIRELAKEAGIYYYRKGKLQVDMEKFAEVIVKGCMEQVWYTRENVIDSNISEVIKERIKEHFGVEDV